jgi:citrate synthase
MSLAAMPLKAPGVGRASPLASKKKMMGFGHRAYKTGDPRAFLLTEKAKELCERTDNMNWYETASIVRETMVREKNIFPNVDFPTAYIYYVMGLPIDIYTPMFAVARVAGWCSHMVEQLDNNRLIRPKANYEGPQHVPFVAMSDR